MNTALRLEAKFKAEERKIKNDITRLDEKINDLKAITLDEYYEKLSHRIQMKLICDRFS